MAYKPLTVQELLGPTSTGNSILGQVVQGVRAYSTIANQLAMDEYRKEQTLFKAINSTENFYKSVITDIKGTDDINTIGKLYDEYKVAHSKNKFAHMPKFQYWDKSIDAHVKTMEGGYDDLLSLAGEFEVFQSVGGEWDFETLGYYDVNAPTGQEFSKVANHTQYFQDKIDDLDKYYHLSLIHI